MKEHLIDGNCPGPYQVVCADIDRAGGKTAADRIRAAGGAARFVRTDVAIAQQVEALVEGTAGRPEWIDVFFNNAGILISGGAERRAHERHPPRTSRFGRRSGAGAGIPPSDDRPPASGRRDPPPGVETTSGR